MQLRLKRWLYLLHRWSGIALCIVFAAWFLSGMVMLYVGYPKLTNEERLQGLAVLQPQGCCVPLPQALAAAGLDRLDAKAAAAFTWRLSSVAGQPRYLFADGNKRAVAVDARTGQRIGPVASDEALASASHFADGAPTRYLEQVQEDAWTHSRALDAHRPLHIVAVDDTARRWLYVSGRTGEVVRDASFTERSWGWLGAWLHWLYLFRGGALNAWWTDIVIWLSVAGSVLALSGAVVGVMRWRWRQPYRSGSRTPYTGFMARWHHWLGLGGGVLAFTWVLSGLFSMNPWKMFDAPGPRPDRLAYAGGPLQATAAPAAGEALATLMAQGVPARELEWRRVGGQHIVLAHGVRGTQVLGPQGLLPQGLGDASVLLAATALLPKAHVLSQERLDAYDSHYYAREPHTMGGGRERPLPVWRLRFDDPKGTWVTLDPRTGAIVHTTDSLRRIDRWLFAFLHSFDLPALLGARPLWDGWMIGFSLAGLGLSLTGIVSGTRRLLRRVPRTPPAARAATTMHQP